MLPVVTNIGLGVPDESYTQEEIFKVLALKKTYWPLFESAGILQRRLCYPPEVILKSTAQEYHEHYFKSALELSLKSVKSCLSKAGLSPGDIDAVSYCSCTGFTCPGMEHYIAKELNMRDDIVLTPIVGAGCGALGPSMRRMWDYLRLNPNHKGLCVATEISNAAFHYKMDNIGLVIGNSIFADGSACVLMEGISDKPGLALLEFDHLHDYKNIDTVAMVWDDARLKLVLPSRTAEISTPMIQRMADRIGRDGIDHYVVHSGGASILNEAVGVLGGDKEKLKHSFKIWKEYGNMSSATTGFALASLLESGELKKRDAVVIITLGAGFECDGILSVYQV